MDEKMRQNRVQSARATLLFVDMLFGVILPALIMAVLLFGGFLKGADPTCDCFRTGICSCVDCKCPAKQFPVNAIPGTQKPPQTTLPWFSGLTPPQAPNAPQNANVGQGTMVLVTVESVEGNREKISWEGVTKDGKKSINSAITPAGVRADEKWAESVVKAVACADGKCPLVLKVKLRRKD